MKSKLQKLRASAQDLGKGVGTAIFAAWLQKMAGI